jgi:hypothetical protein
MRTAALVVLGAVLVAGLFALAPHDHEEGGDCALCDHARQATVLVSSGLGDPSVPRWSDLTPEEIARPHARARIVTAIRGPPA